MVVRSATYDIRWCVNEATGSEHEVYKHNLLWRLHCVSKRVVREGLS